MPRASSVSGRAHPQGDFGDALHLDGEAAEDAEPHDRENGRADEAADDHLGERVTPEG